MKLPANINAWPTLWRDRFEERGGIIEFMSNISRFAAEIRAEQDVRQQAAQEKREERTA